MHTYTPHPTGGFCTATHPDTGAECGLGPAHPFHDHAATAAAPTEVAAPARPADRDKAQQTYIAMCRKDTTPLALVFGTLALTDRYGATDEELTTHTDLTGLGPNTIRPRRIDLVNAGLVTVATDGQGRDVTRPTATGKQARVWVITDHARALLASHLSIGAAA